MGEMRVLASSDLCLERPTNITDLRKDAAEMKINHGCDEKKGTSELNAIMAEVKKETLLLQVSCIHAIYAIFGNMDSAGVGVLLSSLYRWKMFELIPLVSISIVGILFEFGQYAIKTCAPKEIIGGRQGGLRSAESFDALRMQQKVNQLLDLI